MIGEHKKVLICFCDGNIVEVVDEESGQNIYYEIVESNDYLEV